jgi:hypothetical protein
MDLSASKNAFMLLRASKVNSCIHATDLVQTLAEELANVCNIDDANLQFLS